MASPTRRVRISHKGGEAHTFVLYPALPVGELTELLGSVFNLRGGQDGNIVGLRAKDGAEGRGGLVVPLSLACRFPDQLSVEEYEVVVAAPVSPASPQLPPPITIGGVGVSGGASEANTDGGVQSRVRELCVGSGPSPSSSGSTGPLLSPQVGSVLVAGLDQGLVPQGLLTAAYTHYEAQQQQLCAFLLRLTEHLRSEEGRVLLRAQDRLLTALTQLTHDTQGARGGGLSGEGAGLLTGLVLEEDPSVLALALPPTDSPQHSEAFDPLAIRTGLLSIAKSRGVGDEQSLSSPQPADTPPTHTTPTHTPCGREELWGAIQSLQTPTHTNALAITPHDARVLQSLLCEDEGALQGALGELRAQAGPQGLALALHALALASRTLPHDPNRHTPPTSPLPKGCGRQVVLCGSGAPLAPAVALTTNHNDRTQAAKRECAFTPVPDELVGLLNEAVASGYLSSLQALLAVKLWGAGQAPDIVRAYTRYKRSKDGGRDLVNTVASRLRAAAKATASVGPEGSAAATDGGSQRGDYEEEDDDTPQPALPDHDDDTRQLPLLVGSPLLLGGKGATGAGVRRAAVTTAVVTEEDEDEHDDEGQHDGGEGGEEGVEGEVKPRCASSSLLSLSSSSASGSDRGDHDDQDLDHSQGVSQSTHLSSLPPHDAEEVCVLSQGERDALTHLTQFLQAAGQLAGWECGGVLSCLDASHPQHSYLCRLYRHSLTGHSTGLDWLAAHLKALAAHTHNNNNSDTTQDTGGAAQPPPSVSSPSGVSSPSPSRLSHRLEVLQRLTRLHVLPQAAYDHFKHGLEGGDPEVEAFFDSYDFPKGDMAGLAQGLEEACARLQATHGSTGGGGCCHDDHAPPHTHTPQAVSSRWWTVHRVDVLDRLAALRLLDHALAQHAKQLLLEGEASLHDIFDNYETQGDMKGLVDSLETLLGDTAPHPPHQHPHTAAADSPAVSDAAPSSGGASVSSSSGVEGDRDGLLLLLPIISQLHLTPPHTQALRHAIAQHDPNILRALKEFKRTRDPQHLSQRLADLVHSLPTPPPPPT